MRLVTRDPLYFLVGVEPMDNVVNTLAAAGLQKNQMHNDSLFKKPEALHWLLMLYIVPW